jgi:thioredoxin reductase (NADPH)
VTQKDEYQVLIIGTGPAGLTAAIYAARAELGPIIFAGEQPGGQLTITTDVDNYPGFPDGVMGPELMDLTTRQAERFGTEVVYGEVTSIDTSVRPFSVTIDGEHTVLAHAVIIASGARARLLGLDSESRLMGYGVSACATCDGFFFKGKELAVVGGGDTAMEEATFLTKFATKVTVIHRRSELRASKIMQQRAFDNPKVAFKWNKNVTDVIGSREGGVQAVVLTDTQTGETEEFKCEGLFIAIGHIPNTAFLGDQLETDADGYMVVLPGTTVTNVPGVFAAGDVADRIYKQAVTAAGTGCMAALDAEKYLEGH